MAEDLALFSSLFEGSFPDEWKRDPEFSRYLSELTSLTINRLTREPALIKEEQECVLNSTQKLAFNNYKTFIQTAECSKDVFREFIAVERHVDQLVEKIPGFSAYCKQFGKHAQDISSKRKLNSLALSRHTQLLEILEIPQLMETCVRNGYYEEALELSTHVRRMEKKHTNISIIKNIGNDTERCRQLMLNQLVQQLQGNLQLPACLRLVGLLRRMNVFSETELKLKFIQSRDYWLQSVLTTIPKNDPYLHISKTIEACRVHLFDIVTQYKAIFPDDDSILAGIHGNAGKQSEGTLFCGWLNSKIWQFLRILETDLRRGVGGRIDSLLSQCMYFGLSFSRVGADFRSLIMPIFVRVSLHSFQLSVREAKHEFHEAMKHFTLTQTIPSFSSSSFPTSGISNFLSPPHSLLSYHPLEILTNALVAAFNDMRSCAPIAMAPEVSKEVERLLQSAVRDIGEYHRIEHETFTQAETQAFNRLCRVIIVDFLPFIEQCLSLLFPEDAVQHVASCTPLSIKHTHQDNSLSLTTTRRKIIVNIGISAETLAEPMRNLVPEVFEEIEKEKMKQSVANIHNQLLEPVTPVKLPSHLNTTPHVSLTTPTSVTENELSDTRESTEISESLEKTLPSENTTKEDTESHVDISKEHTHKLDSLVKPIITGISEPIKLSDTKDPVSSVNRPPSGWEDFNFGFHSQDKNSSNDTWNTTLGDNTDNNIN